VFAGACVGFGFLAKMLQAFLVVPVFALVYLLAAPTGVRRRLFQLLAAGAAMVVAGGWWVAIVQLIPASARPYIGGSQHNSVLELTLGYNGFGRLTGDETGGLGNTNQGVGALRLFGSELGGQVAWLLPAALILLVALVWITRRAPRTHPLRAAALLWGGWLLVTGAVFSLMNGIFHGYYTVALAPAVAALFGMGTAYLWTLRGRRPAALALAAVFAVTAVWAYALLGRTPQWQPWLRWVILAVGLVAAVAVAATAFPAVRAWGRRFALVAAGVAVVTALAGPAAYAVQTAATPHTGAIPSAGPSGQGGFGMGPGGFAHRGQARPPGFPGQGRQSQGKQGRARGQGQQGQGRWQGRAGNHRGTGGMPGMNGRRGGMGGPGGLLGGSTPSAAATKALSAGAGSYTWVAAAVGANNAAGYQLATGRPVMALGGFNGTDPSPTLAQFKRYVADGRIHYFAGGSVMGGGRAATGSQAAQDITSWVKKHYPAVTVGGVTMYDLSK
jgi:4-amino-4-deoxy-L-arabinose transferase-like glycosyltransferase